MEFLVMLRRADCSIDSASNLILTVSAQALAGFLTKARLGIYETKRNDPNADAISGMSPYLHFGQISAARCALEAAKHRKDAKVCITLQCCGIKHVLR